MGFRNEDEKEGIEGEEGCRITQVVRRIKQFDFELEILAGVRGFMAARLEA